MPIDYKARLDELEFNINNAYSSPLKAHAQGMASIARELLAEREAPKMAWVEMDDTVNPGEEHHLVAVHLSPETAKNRNVVEVSTVVPTEWFPGCCGLLDE